MKKQNELMETKEDFGKPLSNVKQERFSQLCANVPDVAVWRHYQEVYKCSTPTARSHGNPLRNKPDVSGRITYLANEVNQQLICNKETISEYLSEIVQTPLDPSKVTPGNKIAASSELNKMQGNYHETTINVGFIPIVFVPASQMAEPEMIVGGSCKIIEEKGYIVDAPESCHDIPKRLLAEAIQDMP